MQRTNIYLEERQTRALDERAAAEGLSRAELIRRIIDRALGGGEPSPSADAAAIDLAFGCVSDVEVDLPDRTGSARQAHLDALWGRAT